MSHVRKRLESAIDADVLGWLIAADTALSAHDIACRARLPADRVDLRDSLRRLQRLGAIERVTVHGWSHYTATARGRRIRAELATSGRATVPDDRRPPISDRLVAQIAEAPGMPAADLGRAIGTTHGAATGCLKNLVNAGRVERMRVGGAWRYWPAGGLPADEMAVLEPEYPAHVALVHIIRAEPGIDAEALRARTNTPEIGRVLQQLTRSQRWPIFTRRAGARLRYFAFLKPADREAAHV